MNKSERWLLMSVIILILAVGFAFSQQAPRTAFLTPKLPDTGSEIIAPGPIEVQAEMVRYYNEVEGLYVSPALPGKYPGIIMVHEWWGLNDNIKEMARNLATQGYKVLAVDLFGSVAGNMQEAQARVSTMSNTTALENMSAAKKYLLAHDSSKIAILGWCFGGGQTLRFSQAGEGLSATVIYYGQLSTDSAKLKNITWPVLGIFGDRDSSIPVDQVKAFETTLNRNNTPNEIYIYQGVGHAFANPTGANYAERETLDAWKKTLDFLDKYLK